MGTMPRQLMKLHSMKQPMSFQRTRRQLQNSMRETKTSKMLLVRCSRMKAESNSTT